MAEIATESGPVQIPSNALGVTKQAYGSEKMTLELSKAGKLTGYLNPRYIDHITAGTFVIAETDAQGASYVCRANKLEGGDKVTTDIWQGSKRYPLVKVIFDPLYDLANHNGRLVLKEVRFHPANWKPIRLPNERELRAILGLSGYGAPIGLACAPGGNPSIQHLVYCHPLSDPANGYVGLSVVGKQGRGKTTLARIIAKSFSEAEDPPAVVVLDGEGEFLALNEENPDLSERDVGVLEKLGLNSACKRVKTYKVSNDGSASHTLSAGMLRGRDIINFVTDLPDKSRLELETLCERLYRNWPRIIKEPLTLANLFHAIRNELRCATIHLSQRAAIGNALNLAPLHLFDRAGKAPLNPAELLEPGTVHVISDVGLDLRDQIWVGLYTLLTLGKVKIDERRDGAGLVLVVDELTRRLPSKSSEPYLQKRVAREFNAMLKVGRKRSFAPVLMTQHPSDIPKEILGACGVQIVFQVSTASASWLKPDLKSHQRLIDSLPIGEALLSSVAHDRPVHLKIPRSPTKERKEDAHGN